MEVHQKALNSAKIQLMSRPSSAFFTTMCFSLVHAWDTTIPTASTNGKYIKFNPEFFLSLTASERVFLLLHETMHCALLHMVRLNTKKPVRWNIACDHVINLMLIEQGYQMPKGGLADPAYKGMSSDEVYALLPESADTQSMPGGLDITSPDDDAALTESMKEILVRAAVQSKMQGDKVGCIPGEIQIYLDRLLRPKLPWKTILNRYVRALAKNDYTFKKPNRRFFPEHYLPSMHSEKLIDIAIAVDTSGSVTTADFTAFVSEITQLFRVMKPEKLTIVQFDVSIKSVHTVKTIQQIGDVPFTGRGGTHIRPLIEWANENTPQLLLVFTDGDFGFPMNTTKVPFIWLIHNNPNFSARFGKVINYTINPPK